LLIAYFISAAMKSFASLIGRIFILLEFKYSSSMIEIQNLKSKWETVASNSHLHGDNYRSEAVSLVLFSESGAFFQNRVLIGSDRHSE